MEFELLGFVFTSIAAVLVGIVLYFAFQAIFIWFGAKVAGIKDASFGKAFWTAIATTILLILVNAIFMFLNIASGGLIGLLLSVLVMIWVIKSIFNTGWGKAIVAWIMSIIGVVIATVIVAAVLGLSIGLL